MDSQRQIERLIDHYEHPRHRDALADADVVMPGGNPDCGDFLTVYLRVARSEGQLERVATVGWEGSGCTVSQAAASILSESLNDQRPTLDEVLEMPYEDLAHVLGKVAVSRQPRCATLALSTVKAAIRQYKRAELRRQSELQMEASTG